MGVLTFRLRAFDPNSGEKLVETQGVNDEVLLEQYLTQHQDTVRYFDVLWRGAVVFSESAVPDGYYEDKVISYVPTISKE